MDQKHKEKAERAKGLGRISTEQIEKWNQMTALIFRKVESNDSLDIPYRREISEFPGLPLGVVWRY